MTGYDANLYFLTDYASNGSISCSSRSCPVSLRSSRWMTGYASRGRQDMVLVTQWMPGEGVEADFLLISLSLMGSLS
jgi:hypothetical protein